MKKSNLIILISTLWIHQFSISNTCIEPYEKFELRPPSYDSFGRETEYYKMGFYNRISPDGRFVLMTSSGAGLGNVTLVNLTREANQPIHSARPERTPLEMEAFATLSSFRFLISTSGQHYSFKDVYQNKDRARSLFSTGETGYYAAATEVVESQKNDQIKIRSLAWPNASADSSGGGIYSSQEQGVGELNSTLAYLNKNGEQYNVAKKIRSTPLCKNLQNTEGRIFQTPMISVQGSEFSAVPANPRQAIIDPKTNQITGYVKEEVKFPRIYKIINENGDCERVMDFEYDVGKLTFGYPIVSDKPAPIVFNGSGTRVTETCINFTKDLEFEMNEQIRIQEEYNKALRKAEDIYNDQMKIYNKLMDERDLKIQQLQKLNKEANIPNSQQPAVESNSRTLPDQRYKPYEVRSNQFNANHNRLNNDNKNKFESLNEDEFGPIPKRPIMNYPFIKVPPKKYDPRNIVERDGNRQHCTVQTSTTRGLHYIDRSIKDHVHKKPKTFQILPYATDFQPLISATGFPGMTKDGRVLFPAKWIEYKLEKRKVKELQDFQVPKKNANGVIERDDKGQQIMVTEKKEVEVERMLNIPYDKYGFVKTDPFQTEAVRDFITSYHGLKDSGVTTKSCVTKDEVNAVEKDFNTMVNLLDLKFSY